MGKVTEMVSGNRNNQWKIPDEGYHALGLVLGDILEILYTEVFSSNRFKGIDFRIYQLCWHRYIVL